MRVEFDARKSGTFAANRARGRIALSVARSAGRTRCGNLHEEGSLRIRFPNADPQECEAVVVNTAGGIAGGDSHSFDIALEPATRLVISGAAAEKVYRTHGPDANVSARLTIGEGAALRWLPQETILFDAAGLVRSIEIELAADASLVLAEAVVFGRSAMGETVRNGRLVDRWRLRRQGQLVFADTFRLDGPIADMLAKPATGGGASAVASLLVAPGDETLCASLRALQADMSGEMGVSAWNGILLARFCARDGAALRRDLVTALSVLGRGSLPRLWMN